MAQGAEISSFAMLRYLRFSMLGRHHMVRRRRFWQNRCFYPTMLFLRTRVSVPDCSCAASCLAGLLYDVRTGQPFPTKSHTKQVCMHAKTHNFSSAEMLSQK
eukprot:6211468-Pleurochrysis_carterae.AAC.1